MLTSLRIDNFAIVSHLELDFASGMTAFTGETGAGKSIMIDALMLACGERADASVIRANQDKCDISATFSIEKDSELSEWLLNHDLDANDETILLRRVLYAEGRSKSYINGQPFPLQKLKELSQMLLHIHGQHQHQTLMHHATHRDQLDCYAGHVELRDEVKRQYKICQDLKQSIETFHHQEAHTDKLALLQFQIDELLSLKLEEGEVDRLHDEHHRLHHANDYLQHAQQTALLLSNDEDMDVCRTLTQLLHHLQHLPKTDPSIQNCIELISLAEIQCEEALAEINRFANGVHLDPERLQTIESRMSLLHQIARKYQVTPKDLLSRLEQLQTELEQLTQSQHHLEQLKQASLIETKRYETLALALRASRQRHATKLAEDITQIIRQLGMPKGSVEVVVSPLDGMHAHGLDKVEYNVSTNPGMPKGSLAKVASGGELSRISLAIQLITSKQGAIPTLLFDEVDVGIGGATATLVGQMLRNLGEKLQVFCVTHQPQVASCAHHHFVVEKHSDHLQTYSRIIGLNEEEKVDEIARMLGGLIITNQTRLHAKEMLEQSA